MKKKKGTIWMLGGLLLLAAALFLTVYNLMDEKRAEKVAKDQMSQLFAQITEEKEEIQGGEELYEVYPEMEMPQMEINGAYYIGIIEIPVLGLQLPVMSGEWSYEKLKIAPCRYSGSIYMNDMIIAAHNYNSHFGRIKDLKAGDDVRFIDAEGHVFEYEVGWLETIKENDPISMVEKKEDWDLTLFTCTYSGQKRLTIRCELIQ